MCTVTITFDSDNKIVADLIEKIKENGAMVEEELSGYDATLAALEEVENGDLEYYDNFEDYKKHLYSL